MTTTARTTYRIGTAPLGHAIVMCAPEGESVIEVGIKSYASAVKRRDLWQKREDAAQAKAEKSATPTR